MSEEAARETKLLLRSEMFAHIASQNIAGLSFFSCIANAFAGNNPDMSYTLIVVGVLFCILAAIIRSRATLRAMMMRPEHAR